MPKLWLISQDKNNDYDTYDCAVVVAENAEQARHIHPDERMQWTPGEHPWNGLWRINGVQRADDRWVNPRDVAVEEVGIAMPGEARRVICASFNAG